MNNNEFSFTNAGELKMTKQIVQVGQVERGGAKSGYKWFPGYSILTTSLDGATKIEYPRRTFSEMRIYAKILGIKMPRRGCDIPMYDSHK